MAKTKKNLTVGKFLDAISRDRAKIKRKFAKAAKKKVKRRAAARLR